MQYIHMCFFQMLEENIAEYEICFARIIKIMNFVIYHKYFMSKKYYIKISQTKR